MKKKIISLTLVFLFLLKLDAYGKSNYSVHFLNTGQSDCILIRAQDRNYLIDTGSYFSVPYVIAYLKAQNVSTLDEIIITHYHNDHYGGLISIISMIDTKKVSLPMNEDMMKYKLYDEVRSRGIPAFYIGRGYTINYKDMHLKAIGPIVYDPFIVNNNSLVFVGDIDNITFDFLADCETAEEKDMLRSGELSKCYVIKVPHHGIDTSSSEKLLNVLKPKIAVVTCKAPQSPILSILERYLHLGTSILRTDKQGTIVIEKDESKVNIILDD